MKSIHWLIFSPIILPVLLAALLVSIPVLIIGSVMDLLGISHNEDDQDPHA